MFTLSGLRPVLEEAQDIATLSDNGREFISEVAHLILKIITVGHFHNVFS